MVSFGNRPDDGVGEYRVIGPSRRRLFGALVLSALLPLRASTAAPPDRMWFCPGPGTLDYLGLFESPADWPHARQVMSVFKFYQQHTRMPADPIVGPNTFDAFVRADAFRTLTRWGKKIAIEVAAVKDYYCTADASGMNAAIAASRESVRAIESAGGMVSYLAMDDPFAGGLAPACGGPAPEPSADRVATFVRGVRAAAPSVQVGWIEAYPLSSADAIESMMSMLASRNTLPAFLHMDVDMPFLIRRGQTADFVRDMKRLRSAAADRHMPFGIIIWGNNGDADALYAADAGHLVDSIATTFPGWDLTPDHVIVQSWAESKDGLRITPTNLPEDAPYTHTNLLWSVFRRLHGQTGQPSGAAVGRR